MSASSVQILGHLLDEARREPPGASFLEDQRPLVLFGAGGRGRRIISGLRSAGIRPVAIADNSSHLAGRLVDDVSVLSAEEAVRQHPEAVFVVTIWSDRIGHPFDTVRNQLASLGMRRVASFTALYQRYPDIFLPDFFMDRVETILAAKHSVKATANLWFDATSRAEYVAQTAMRISFDFHHLERGDKFDHTPYFPPDLFKLSDMETFVDCGAYDGDTYRDFIKTTGNRFQRYIAVEPDPHSFGKLAALINGVGETRVRLLQTAVAERSCMMRFTADGSTESRESQTGEQEVVCFALDDILRDEAPSYIKMDIEGAELGALRGARKTLARHRPILAVSAYHRVDDLWSVPTLIDELVQDYAFFLRPEKKAGWDLICYAVPHERVADSKVPCR
jgi:FkbM family methyltransferase